MWHLREPTADDIRAFLDAQRERPFSYPDVGITRADGALPGYDFDRHRVLLGHGDGAFERAAAAIRRWEMFPRPWTRIIPQGAPIEPGVAVAMLARVFGLWWLNACRIVYVVDEAGPPRRFGFAYGTLPAHVESGEEYFGVELRENDEAWYEIRAYSRPRYCMVRLAYPIARQIQRRFARESLAAMRRGGRSPDRFRDGWHARNMDVTGVADLAAAATPFASMLRACHPNLTRDAALVRGNTAG